MLVRPEMIVISRLSGGPLSMHLSALKKDQISEVFKSFSVLWLLSFYVMLIFKAPLPSLQCKEAVKLLACCSGFYGGACAERTC